MNVNLIVGDEVTVKEPVRRGMPTTRIYTGTITKEFYSPPGRLHIFVIEVSTSHGTDPIDPGKEIFRSGGELYPFITEWNPGLKPGTPERRAAETEKKGRRQNLYYPTID